MYNIVIKTFYFNKEFYLSTPDNLLDELVALADYRYYESFLNKCYTFQVDKELEKFEELLYTNSIPYKKLPAV